MSAQQQAYSVLETTRGWVSRRLRDLSAALLLPCPTRDGFLFPADPDFYRLCTDSVVTLQGAAKRILQHVGLTCDLVVVTFRSDLPHPGRIEHDGSSFFVEINSQHRGDGPALGAILAHECCHILVAARGVGRLGTVEDEVHVDLASILAGLGPLTLNGVDESQQQRGDVIVLQQRSFGYLRAPLLCHAYARTASLLGLDRARAVSDLRGTAREAVDRLLLGEAARRWLRRATRRQAPLLAYAPPGEHLVVPCARPACGQRLRLPAGKVGRLRCPSCGTERAFDGSVCRIEPRLAPQPLGPAMTPAAARWRARAGWFARVPLRVRLALAALLLFFVGGGVLCAVTELRRPGLGERCREDHECRSRICLRVGDAPALDALRAATEGLGLRYQPPPEPAGGRSPWIREAYCTRECTVDDDCPGGLSCGEARTTAAPHSRWQGPVVQVGGASRRVCVKR